MPVTDPIGTRYFKHIEKVVLVEVVEQRDEPPGRGTSALKETVLAASSTRIMRGREAEAIASVLSPR